MEFNVSVQYNGGLLPDIILSTQSDAVTLGNPFDTMKRFCLYSQCSHLNLLTLFHLRWMLGWFRCVQIFLKQLRFLRHVTVPWPVVKASSSVSVNNFCDDVNNRIILCDVVDCMLRTSER